MIVYQAYNPISNKFYIGKTIKPIWIRRKKHAYDAERKANKALFHRAIRKYGIEAFEWAVICTAETLQELSKFERHWIRLLSEAGHQLYNLRSGGDGGSLTGKENHNYGKSVSAARRVKISKSLRHYYKSHPNPMQGRIGYLSPQFGKPRTEEEKRKISMGLKGKKRYDMYGAKNPSARGVICITTKEKFKTATEAARKYTSDLSSIIKCCKGKVRSVKGKVYIYSKPGVHGWIQVE